MRERLLIIIHLRRGLHELDSASKVFAMAYRLALIFVFIVTQFANAAPGRMDTPAGVAKAIEGIRVEDVAWRKIAWKSCLLEGLAEARRTGKPLMIWCYIDRPVGDTRC